MRVLAEIGARGVDGQRPVTLVKLVSQAEMATMLMNMMNEGCIHNVNLFIATIAI